MALGAESSCLVQTAVGPIVRNRHQSRLSDAILALDRRMGRGGAEKEAQPAKLSPRRPTNRCSPSSIEGAGSAAYALFRKPKSFDRGHARILPRYQGTASPES
jgi:hypothetical protein